MFTVDFILDLYLDGRITADERDWWLSQSRDKLMGEVKG